MGSSASVQPSKTNQKVVNIPQQIKDKVQQNDKIQVKKSQVNNNNNVTETENNHLSLKPSFSKEKNTKLNSSKISARNNSINNNNNKSIQKGRKSPPTLTLNKSSLQKKSQIHTKKPSPITPINKSIADKYISDCKVHDNSSSSMSKNKSRINDALLSKKKLPIINQSQPILTPTTESNNKQARTTTKRVSANNNSSLGKLPTANLSLNNKNVDKQQSKSTAVLKALNMKLATAGGNNSNLASSTTNIASKKTVNNKLLSSLSNKKVGLSASKVKLTSAQKQTVSSLPQVHPFNQEDRLMRYSVKQVKSKPKIKKIDQKINQLIKLYGI